MFELSTVEPATVARLVKDIDTRGFAVLENFIAADQLQQAREFITRQVAEHGPEYFALHGLAAMRDSLFADLATSPAFRQMLNEVYETGLNLTLPPDETTFPVIRFLQGRTGRKESHFFHFDATGLTALVPIVIPTEGQYCGDLITFPNIRPVRRSVMVNVIEKAILHNTVSQKLTSWLVGKGWLKPVRIKLKPGNVYLFWGYRSLHANDPCDPSMLRATALYHYGNPHRHSRLAKRLLGRNQRNLPVAETEVQVMPEV